MPATTTTTTAPTTRTHLVAHPLQWARPLYRMLAAELVIKPEDIERTGRTWGDRKATALVESTRGNGAVYRPFVIATEGREVRAGCTCKGAEHGFKCLHMAALLVALGQLPDPEDDGAGALPVPQADVDPWDQEEERRRDFAGAMVAAEEQWLERRAA